MRYPHVKDSAFLVLWVELEGIEPSSKWRTNLLSTCLSSYWFVGQGVGRKQPWAMPYPLKSSARYRGIAMPSS